MAKGANPTRSTARQPGLVLACLLALHGLVFKTMGSSAHRPSMGGFLPASFVSWALSLSSLVFLIAAVATVAESISSGGRERNWRPLGSLVFALMGMTDLVAGLFLAQSEPGMSWLLRVLGMPIALSGVAMGVVAFSDARRGSERLAAVAGLVLNSFVFLVGVAGSLVVRVASY